MTGFMLLWFQKLTINFFLFIRKVLCLENHIYRKCIKHCKWSQGIWLEEVSGDGHLPQGKGVLGSPRNLTSRKLNCLQVLAAWLWGVGRSGHCKGREKLIETKEDAAERWEGLPKVSLYPLSFTFPFIRSVSQSLSIWCELPPTCQVLRIQQWTPQTTIPVQKPTFY